MYVRSVHYQNWRNLAEASADFSPGINVLWGMNAQGKSNILEGIYFFARGRSFRGARERELVRFGSDFARADLAFRRDTFSEDTALDAVLPLSGKKRLAKNGAPLSSIAEMLGLFRAVLFTPQNLSTACSQARILLNSTCAPPILAMSPSDGSMSSTGGRSPLRNSVLAMKYLACAEPLVRVEKK